MLALGAGLLCIKGSGLWNSVAFKTQIAELRCEQTVAIVSLSEQPSTSILSSATFC